MYCSLFTHSPVDENLGCFQFLAITNKAVMNICVQVFVCTYAFFSLGEIAGSKMAELYDVCIFNFLIKCQTLSQVAVPLYVTPSSVVIVSSSSSTCQHLLWSVLLFEEFFIWLIQILCQTYVLRIFSSSLWLAFFFSEWWSSKRKVYNFEKIQFINF